MEYERALFRVYDRSMEGFRAPAVRNACNLIQQSLLIVSAGLVVCLVLLHRDFVNKPGCLGKLLEDAARREGVLMGATPRVISITSNNTLGTVDIPNSRDVVGQGGDENGKDEDFSGEEGSEGNGESDEKHPSRIQLASGHWIPSDVLIGVSIGSGGGVGAEGQELGGLRGGARDGDERPDGNHRRRYRRRVEGEEDDGDGGNKRDAGGEEELADSSSSMVMAASLAPHAAEASWNDTGFSADYTFAFEPYVLLLPEKIQRDHRFHWINFTVDPSECFEKASFLSRALAATVVGYDTIIANMFMFSVRSKGLLMNIETETEWVWSRDPKPSSMLGFERFLRKTVFKAEVVVRSITAFVLMSTVTAMTVRTLLSSGVVIIFPVVMLMERLGLRGGEMRMLALSYPWLGLPIEHLRRNNKPIGTFIMGHVMQRCVMPPSNLASMLSSLTMNPVSSNVYCMVCFLHQMLVFYTVYNACLLAWSSWLYGKSMATSLQVSLYGMVMLWEYFALIFVRARSSIVFFSRTAALLFVAFHVYFYHFQMGFFGIAAAAAFCSMLAVKLYVLRAIELPAYVSGQVSHEQPRAHFVELPWPTWDSSLPPIWSLFIPPNASSVGIYGDVIPDRPPGENGDNNSADNAGGNIGGAGASSSGGDEIRNIPSARSERNQARARGRGRARARGYGTPSARTGRATTEQERPLVANSPSVGSGEEIEMAPRRRPGWRDAGDDG